MRQNTLINSLQIANHELNNNSAVERTTVWLNSVAFKYGVKRFKYI